MQPPSEQPTEDSNRQLRSLLELSAAMHWPVPWIVAPIPSLGKVLLCDERNEASTLLLDAIASDFGVVVASDSMQATLKNCEIIGCLIQVDSNDLESLADRLRAAYALAIDAGSNEPPV